MRRLTRKGKRIRNKKILMVSTICLLLCLSIGYAAFSTSLSLKAKGNIKTKTYTSQEIKDIFCNGENDSGLYKDIYEDGKCTYRGSSPNNYITFNNETWRIISIDANNFIKIIKNESIGSRAWDSTLNNNWNRPSDIKTYLNEEYLKNINTNKDKIVEGIYAIGVNYGYEISEVVDDEQAELWTGKIGLITVSEYMRASKQNNCSVTVGCPNENWLQDIIPLQSSLWTITPSQRDTNVYFVNEYVIESGDTKSNFEVLPTVYLSSDIILQGEGTIENPFQITN